MSSKFASGRCCGVRSPETPVLLPGCGVTHDSGQPEFLLISFLFHTDVHACMLVLLRVNPGSMNGRQLERLALEAMCHN